MLSVVRRYIGDHWRVLVFATVAVASLIAALLYGGIAAAPPLIITALSALLLRTGTAKAPRPRLSLVELAQPDLWAGTNAMRSISEIFGHAPDYFAAAPPAPAAGVTIGSRRPLEIDELVEDAVRNARAQAPGTGSTRMLAMARYEYAEPTAADQERFDELVSEYVDAVRAWLIEIDAYLTERSRILVASILQTNPADVDATDALVLARFPHGFAPGEITNAPDAPEVPTFPLRRSAMSIAMRDYGVFGHQSVARPYLGGISHLGIGEVASLWEPDYEQRPAGLQASYRRQPIRHGEEEVAGEPLVLTCPETGEHRIEWEIHAANLPRAATGTWTITCHSTQTGDPVRSMYDLRELLATLDDKDPDTS